MGEPPRARCPICRGPSGPRPHAPFCSARCKVIDLGRWLGGDYRIAGPALALDEGEGEIEIDLSHANAAADERNDPERHRDDAGPRVLTRPQSKPGDPE